MSTPKMYIPKMGKCILGIYGSRHFGNRLDGIFPSVFRKTSRHRRCREVLRNTDGVEKSYETLMGYIEPFVENTANIILCYYNAWVDIFRQV